LARSLLKKAPRTDWFAIGLLIIMALALPRPSDAQTGGTSGAYLHLVVGAAGLGMGGANAADPDYYMPWWNPAALGFLRNEQISGGTGIRTFGRLDGYGSFELPVPLPARGCSITPTPSREPVSSAAAESNSCSSLRICNCVRPKVSLNSADQVNARASSNSRDTRDSCA